MSTENRLPFHASLLWSDLGFQQSSAVNIEPSVFNLLKYYWEPVNDKQQLFIEQDLSITLFVQNNYLCKYETE